MEAYASVVILAITVLVVTVIGSMFFIGIKFPKVPQFVLDELFHGHSGRVDTYSVKS